MRKDKVQQWIFRDDYADITMIGIQAMKEGVLNPSLNGNFADALHMVLSDYKLLKSKDEYGKRDVGE